MLRTAQTRCSDLPRSARQWRRSGGERLSRITRRRHGPGAKYCRIWLCSHQERRASAAHRAGSALRSGPSARRARRPAAPRTSERLSGSFGRASRAYEPVARLDVNRFTDPGCTTAVISPVTRHSYMIDPSSVVATRARRDTTTCGGSSQECTNVSSSPNFCTTLTAFTARPDPGAPPGPRPSLGDHEGAVTGRAPLARAPGRLPENPRPRQGRAASRSPSASLVPAGEPSSRDGPARPRRSRQPKECGNVKIQRASRVPVARSAGGHERARAVTTAWRLTRHFRIPGR